MAPIENVRARPLAGKRIVITRAAQQADEFVARLSALGAETILLPMVRFVTPEDTAQLDQSLTELDSFDWLIFTSANAVRFFLRHWRGLDRKKLDRKEFPSRLHVAAVGSATRAAAENEGLRVALVPAESSGAGLAAELGAEVAGKRVLLPRSDRAADDLPRALRARGAAVTEVVAYRTVEPESLDAAVVDRLRGGGVDVVAFFSPSALHNFVRALGDEFLRDVNTRVALAAVGPVTAAAIRGAGLPVAVEAPEATAQSFAAALETHFAQTSPQARQQGPDRKGRVSTR